VRPGTGIDIYVAVLLGASNKLETLLRREVVDHELAADLAREENCALNGFSLRHRGSRLQESQRVRSASILEFLTKVEQDRVVLRVHAAP